VLFSWLAAPPDEPAFELNAIDAGDPEISDYNMVTQKDFLIE